jgi:prepilin-type N-terminal cleavage/methylation domain-containing protein
MRARIGFTLIEVLVVVLIAGIVAGTTLPRLGRAMAGNRVQRAASVVAADLQLAHSMAARQRRPVVIQVDTVRRWIRVNDVAVSTTVYSERRLGTDSEFGLTRLTASPAQVVVYPTGIANNSIDITLRSGDQVRLVRMTRAGQIRTTAP